MTATMLSPDDIDRAQELQREIGDTFRRARDARGETLSSISYRIGLTSSSTENLARFERGTDAKLGTIIRNLGAVGYTLAVVPIVERTPQRPAPQPDIRPRPIVRVVRDF